MEFWGIEVKSGELAKVDPGEDKIVHISQVALGESKSKGNEPVHIYLIVDHQKFVVGTLTQEKFPQLMGEILLEKGFELSHSWKNGSVYFTGYKVDARDYEAGDSSDDDELPVVSNREKSKPKPDQVKPEVKKTDAAKSGTKQVNFKVPNIDAKATQDDDDDDDSDEDSEDDMSSSEDSGDDEDKKVNAGGDNDEDSDEEEEDDDDETSDDETPKKPEQSKKRPAEGDTPKTPASDKKAKFTTPQKTEAKKTHVHIATPHPAKQMGKKAGMGEGSKQQTPKSGGSNTCKSCNRSFTSEAGLQSHTKAKHGAAA